MSSEDGLLLALQLREPLEKDAGLMDGFRAGMRRMRPSRRTLALGAGAAGIGGAGFAAGRLTGDEVAIKVKGGMLYLKHRDHLRFQQILKSTGPRAAAQFALQLVKSKQARFERGARKMASEIVDAADLDFSVKEAAALGNAKQWLGKFSRNLSDAGKMGDLVGLGMLMAGAGALFGLGAEIVDRGTDLAINTGRNMNKERRYAATVDMVKRFSDPEQLHAMGVGPRPADSPMATTDPRALVREEQSRKERERNFRQSFDLMHKYAPLTTADPVVTALVLKQYAMSGQPPDRAQIKDMLELEQNMGKVREMSPFRLRLTGGSKGIGSHVSAASTALLGGS